VDLRTVATRQKAMLLCLLGQITLFVLQFVLPAMRPLLGLAYLAVGITAAVFVFMLCLTVYNTTMGIILGILTLIPLIGLLVLLIVNGKATKLLQEHGIKVGLLGANASQIPAPGQTPRR
jgi:hypothetical protein